MKRRKIIAAILFVISGILLTAFAVKTYIDGVDYSRTINSAPFILHIAVNALLFITPSLIIAGAALFILRRTRALGIVTAALWVLSLLTVIATILQYGNAASGFADGLLYALPFAVSAIVDTVLSVVSRRRSLKTES